MGSSLYAWVVNSCGRHLGLCNLYLLDRDGESELLLP